MASTGPKKIRTNFVKKDKFKTYLKGQNKWDLECSTTYIFDLQIWFQNLCSRLSDQSGFLNEEKGSVSVPISISIAKNRFWHPMLIMLTTSQIVTGKENQCFNQAKKENLNFLKVESSIFWLTVLFFISYLHSAEETLFQFNKKSWEVTNASPKDIDNIGKYNEKNIFF